MKNVIGESLGLVKDLFGKFPHFGLYWVFEGFAFVVHGYFDAVGERASYSCFYQGELEVGREVRKRFEKASYIKRGLFAFRQSLLEVLRVRP